MKYFFIDPNNTTTEFTNDVIIGANNITEFCFDLESNVLPSDVSITVDNNRGNYSPEVNLFTNYEVNRLLVRITDDDDNLLFIGVFIDPKYDLNKVKFKVSNVIYLILNESTNSLTIEDTPSNIILHILRGLSISNSLIDLDQFYRMHFIFSSLSDILADYSTPSGVDTTANTVDFNLLEAIRHNNNQLFKFVSGKYVFKKDSYQKLKVAISEQTTYIDIFKEITKLTGLLIFTDKGRFTCRLYPFGEEFYNTIQITSDLINSKNIKYDKPVLWRRKSFTIPYDVSGTVTNLSKESSALNLSDVNILSDLFAAKDEQISGLSGKIIHSDITSCNNALDSLLLLRSLPRYHVTFTISLGTTEGNNLAANIKLFSFYTVAFLDLIAKILPIKISRKDDSITITAITANELYVYDSTVLSDIETYETANTNASKYYVLDTNLINDNITNLSAIDFAHRENRNVPNIVRINDKVYITNGTGYNVTITYSSENVALATRTFERHDYIELTTNDNIFNVRVSYNLTHGTITENYTGIRLLDISNSCNYLLSNYTFALYSDDNTGVIY